MNPKKAVSSNPTTANYYQATPEPGTGKGVQMLHAWWGLNPFFGGLCERLAQEGYYALAPDLYHGLTASNIEEAKKLRAKLKQDTVSQGITRAAEQLRTISSAGGKAIGVVGFSLGGYYALWLAEQVAVQVAATVMFYGTRNSDYTDSRSAFQFHFAETDDYVAASGVKKLQKSLQAAGKEAEFYTYPGTTHWYFEDDRPGTYQAQAADLAWSRAIEFLKKHIR
jgi:carboxymethylenebutenolidase